MGLEAGFVAKMAHNRRLPPPTGTLYNVQRHQGLDIDVLAAKVLDHNLQIAPSPCYRGHCWYYVNALVDVSRKLSALLGTPLNSLMEMLHVNFDEYHGPALEESMIED